MLDPDIQLLMSILRNATQLDPLPSEQDLLQRFKAEVALTCSTLESLLLVEEAANSPLGVKPTPRFIQIVADKLTRTEPKLCNPFGEIGVAGMHMIMEHAGGNSFYYLWRGVARGAEKHERSKAKKLCRRVLVKLGLLEKLGAGYYEPTNLMQDLMFGALDRYCKERKPQLRGSDAETNRRKDGRRKTSKPQPNGNGAGVIAFPVPTSPSSDSPAA